MPTTNEFYEGWKDGLQLNTSMSLVSFAMLIWNMVLCSQLRISFGCLRYML